MGYDKK
jgi:hypothetical protein